jgi:hypothetical protein
VLKYASFTLLTLWALSSVISVQIHFGDAEEEEEEEEEEAAEKEGEEEDVDEAEHEGERDEDAEAVAKADTAAAHSRKAPLPVGLQTAASGPLTVRGATSVFLPLTFPRNRETRPYSADSPEMQEYLELSKNNKLMFAIKREPGMPFSNAYQSTL